MNQQKSNNIGDAEFHPIQISVLATPTSVTGARHLVPDDLDCRLDGRHLQSLGGDHDDVMMIITTDNLRAGHTLRAESHEPQIERGGDTCTQHWSTARVSRVLGHWLLASTNMRTWEASADAEFY